MLPSFESTLHPDHVNTDPRFFRVVQYVLGELSVTEQDAFEADLLNDESLCVMVAEASRLVSGVRQAIVEAKSVSVTVPVRQSYDREVKRDRWTVAAVLAAAAVMAAFGLANFNASPPSTAAVAHPSEAVKLVALWRSTGRTVVGSTVTDGPFDSEAPSAVLDDRVPPWMMAAVSLENRRAEHRQGSTSLPESDEAWEDN